MAGFNPAPDMGLASNIAPNSPIAEINDFVMKLPFSLYLAVISTRTKTNDPITSAIIADHTTFESLGRQPPSLIGGHKIAIPK